MTAHLQKGKVALIVLSVLTVILAFSNIYVYANMGTQITSLNTDKTSLQNQVAMLQSQCAALNATYKDYASAHSHTNTEYDTLNATYQNYKALANSLNMLVKYNNGTKAWYNQTIVPLGWSLFNPKLFYPLLYPLSYQ